MSLNVTLYPTPTSVIRVPRAPAHVGTHGRAFVRVEVDGASIQTDCWEDMRRLVDALTWEIAAARQAEQDATLGATA